MTETVTLNEPQEIIKCLAAAAGFSITQPPTLPDAPTLPASAILWRSTYAQLLTIETTAENAENLLTLTNGCQQWLDLACMNEEQGSAAPIDGYLVVILAKKPSSSEVDLLIRSLELNPVACRKHFVWPDLGETADLRWLRIFRITPLGLPSSPAAFEMTGSPVLESEVQKRILEDIRTYRSGQQAARQHIENPSSAPSS